MYTDMKILRSEEDYEKALDTLGQLMKESPKPGSSSADLLEVLSVLIEKYEDENCELEDPDPVDAIKFRMEQGGLSNKDLIHYIGSAPKVSEVLSRKTTLSIKMIRALHNGLGIPYKSLMRESRQKDILERGEDYSLYPLKEMFDRGLLNLGSIKTFSEAKERCEELCSDFFSGHESTRPLLLRTAASSRAGREMNAFALRVWHVSVLKKANRKKLDFDFDLNAMNDEFFRQLLELSVSDHGPELAVELLAKYGIKYVYEPHFKKTYLDGAAMKTESGDPIVAMTARYDRLDNFWFVLMHELAHIKLHLMNKNSKLNTFYDDLDVGASDSIESEADEFAMSRLISKDLEDAISEFKKDLRVSEVKLLARNFKRSPSIIAGYLRKKTGNFRLYSGLVGRGEVRSFFN